MSFDNVWRLSTAQALAVASVGGAAASSAAFGAQTYAVQLSFPGSVFQPVAVALRLLILAQQYPQRQAHYCRRTGSTSFVVRLVSVSPPFPMMRGRSRSRSLS
jgi:hypothetical protein